MLRGSRNEKIGNVEVVDFHMSKIFGLDWKKHDSNRMSAFIAMVGYENEAKNNVNKQQ